MITFKTLTCNSGRKCVSLRNRITHFATFLTEDPTVLSSGYNLALTIQLLILPGLRNEIR